MEENNLQPASYLNNGALFWLMSRIRRSSSIIQQYFLNTSINSPETPSSGQLLYSPPQVLVSSPPPPPSPPSTTAWDNLDVFGEALNQMHVRINLSSSSLSPSPSSSSSSSSPLWPSPPSSSRSEEPKGVGAPPWTPPKPKLTKAASRTESQNSLNSSKLPSKKPTTSNLQTSTSPNQNPSPTLHPVFEILRQQELGKSILVLAIPMIIGLYSFYKPLYTPLILRLAAIFLSIGVVLIWNGILLRKTCNTYPQIIELLGIVFMFSAFFVFVSCFLPANLFILIPGLCWILALFPFCIAYCSRGRAPVGSHEESGGNDDNIMCMNP